ncbi:MAG TPA: CocE/NonD family hydrolase [Burkholderiales bacterium]|nr:CocE/NonD family hydrolase [Burkholderiales bacterium]
MTRKPERLAVDGPAGKIEIVVDHPSVFPTEGAAEEAARGVALVAHPHPLFGGTLDNKVAQTLARTFTELGYIAVRPNFRGVGASEGEHDHGDGETDDLVHVIDWALGRFGPLAVALAGFSFGAYVQTRVAKRVQAERLALVGVPDGLVAGGRTYRTEPVPADTIVIHGELDETAPLANVLGWARPQELPIVVVPGADHFFHRRLHLIRDIIKRQWKA